MISRGRAQALADALRKMYPKQRRRIDGDLVRMFCANSSEAERDPIDSDWLEAGPLDEVTAWINIEQLLH
jgi:hypothetical protein